MNAWTRRSYRPRTPGARHRVQRSLDREEAGIQWVPKASRMGKKETGGRNHHGRITSRGMGGGLKRVMREVRPLPRGATVVVLGIQRDPGRTAPVALVMRQDTGERRRVLAGQGMAVGDEVSSPWMTSGVGGRGMTSQRSGEIRPHSRCRRGWRPAGATFYDVSLPGGAKVTGDDQSLSTMVKTAGASAMLVGHGQAFRDRVGEPQTLGHERRVGRSRVRLPSGEERRLPEDTCVTVGRVSAEDHRLEVWGKAGSRRRRGVRPTVRGCAMNPVDHPHGGRTKGGRHDVTPWAKIAKGQSTRRPSDMPSHRLAFLVKTTKGKAGRA